MAIEAHQVWRARMRRKIRDTESSKANLNGLIVPLEEKNSTVALRETEFEYQNESYQYSV